MNVPLGNEQKLAEFLLNKPICIFCSDSHKSEDCSMKTDSVSRLESLMRRSLCLVCLSHHTSIPCPRKEFICPLCNHLNHHVAVCYLMDSMEYNITPKSVTLGSIEAITKQIDQNKL